MNRTMSTLVAACALGALTAMGAATRAQPDKPAAPGFDDMEKMLVAMSAPAKEHGALDILTGDWRVEASMMMPGAPTLKAIGAGTGQWILGKRFVQLNTTCKPPAGQLETQTLALYGYDTRTKKYTLVGFDTLGTYYITAEGDYDAATKTFTLLGQNTEGGQTVPFQWTLRPEGDKRLVSEVKVNMGGAWLKVAEVVMTR